MNTRPDKPKRIFPMFRGGKIYRYIVKYTEDKCRVYLGCFKTEAEAAEAYRAHLEKKKGTKND
jgi:L-alanine-DL-glutamate epimerase-like enolase superfamily enzyme